MTPDDHRRLAFRVKTKTSQLLLEQADLSEEAVETSVLSVVGSAIEFARAHLGERAAYDLMQRAADNIIRKPAETDA